MSDIVKLTLSVPKELRQRMATFDDAVNWSELARNAFQRRVEMLEESKGSKLSTRVLARLKQSAERADDEDKKAGYTAGKRWAEEHAEVPELRRLRDQFADGIPGTDDPAWTVYEAIDTDAPRAPDAYEFWEVHSGEPTPSGAFVEAFVDGALEVLNAFEEAE